MKKLKWLTALAIWFSHSFTRKEEVPQTQDRQTSGDNIQKTKYKKLRPKTKTIFTFSVQSLHYKSSLSSVYSLSFVNRLYL